MRSDTFQHAINKLDSPTTHESRARGEEELEEHMLVEDVGKGGGGEAPLEVRGGEVGIWDGEDRDGGVLGQIQGNGGGEEGRNSRRTRNK
ncbi:uncharacterized protein J3R85_001412 [Psidium guajava]|nr:uncharacterized protein J3R85_001412 [Psidium guajava]